MRIAIADDQSEVREFVRTILQQAEYASAEFANGRQMIRALQLETYDLLLVDWNMPEQSGIDVIRWARSNLVPCPQIIIMTSRIDSNDIVLALEAGADDYIVKPEKQEVILARIRSALRRAMPQTVAARIQTYGDFTFDRSTNTVVAFGDAVALRPKEFTLAELFVKNSHRPLSRGYILQAVWNSVADLPTRTLDMHVSRVRTKLKLNPENGYRLQTVFGYGYRFEKLQQNE